MFRYIAIVRSGSIPFIARQAQVLRARLEHDRHHWALVFSSPRMWVYCTDDQKGSNRINALQNGGGVVLGTIFRNGSRSAVRNGFSESETSTIVSNDEYLSANYWGRYVALVSDKRGGTFRIQRSATGELDCFAASIKGTHIFFSEYHNALSSVLKPEFDWEYLAAHLCQFVTEARDTALASVRRIVHGECLSLSGDGSDRKLVWNPATVAKMDTIEDPREASRLLFDAAEESVHGWASCHPRIVEMLSGGLDSSIVLGLLNRAPQRPDVVCLNLRSSHDLSTDERPLAELVARHNGARLIEKESDMEFSLEGSSVLRSMNVFDNIYALSPSNLSFEIAREFGANAYYSGHGGDQIFYQNGAHLAWIDYNIARGIRPHSLVVAADAARIEGDSIWGILSQRRARDETPLRRMKWHPFIDAEVQRSALQRWPSIHPWLEACDDVLPGKRWHITMIASCMSAELYSSAACESDCEMVSPLVSQRLLECCLRIPTYILIEGGVDRALARRTFEEQVPREVSRRVTKAITRDAAKYLLGRNRSIVRSILLDGVLSRSKTLNRRAVEDFLSDNGAAYPGNPAALLNLVACELWLTGWTRPVQSIAA
jgi:asparagine synthase (glutamine-hydrolysing)